MTEQFRFHTAQLGAVLAAKHLLKIDGVTIKPRVQGRICRTVFADGVVYYGQGFLLIREGGQRDK